MTTRVDEIRASRRSFLRFLGVSAACASAEAALPVRVAGASSTRKSPAREHAGDVGILIDVTRCVGCGWCTMACKAVNGLPEREDQPWVGPDAALASSNWSAVRQVEVDGNDDRSADRFVKRQCMHCLEPTCVSVCPVKAMRKLDSGPVVYDGDRCIGCRYCVMACPFGVPTFEWDRSFGRISKCTLCAERIADGQQPACAVACPRNAITFGGRDELLEEAHRRIQGAPDSYIHHVYGETEAGGTSVLYLSDVPFEELGLPTQLPDQAPPEYTWKISRLIPGTAAGLGGLLVALYVRRRRALLEREHAGRPGTWDDPAWDGVRVPREARER